MGLRQSYLVQIASSLVQARIFTNKTELEIIALLGNPQNHPAIPGAAYWLVDEKSEGKFSRLDGPGSKANLPMWKLIEW